MSSIIDIHTHLGDILYTQGHTLIHKTGVWRWPDWGDLQERYGWPDWPLLNKRMRPLARRLDILTGLNRNRSGTLQNLQQEMDRYGVKQAIVLPVYPHVTFDHLQTAGEQDRRLHLFTGPDYHSMDRTEEKFRQDIARGAAGIKLHPILNQVPLDDEKNFQILDIFGQYQKPVLFHCGVTYYYLKKSEKRYQTPVFGKVAPAKTVVERFPHIKFIVGHAGIGNMPEVIELLSGYQNVWVDISFQPSEKIKRLIDAFGAERVLFGSDWPWGGMGVALQMVEQACSHDPALLDRVLYQNAEELLSS